MPSGTETQRHFMCADWTRAKEGKKTSTGMSATKLEHYCTEPIAKKKRKNPVTGK